MTEHQNCNHSIICRQLEFRKIKIADKLSGRSQFENVEDKIYHLGDYCDERIIMQHLGLDIGTKTIVLAFKNKNQTRYITETNGYWAFERSTPFIENMLNDANRLRADGTKRPARWIKLPNSDKIIVLGADAEEFAYATNDTMLRPMAEGGIAPDEEAMTVLSSIIHSLLSMAEKDLGQFDDELKICYCTTAPSINKESNIDYHERVINLILTGYETKTHKIYHHIKESHAIVLDMSQDGTGIGISWGAGTVTVSFVKNGLELNSFSWVGAGDWIDEQVAMRYGYNSEALKTRRKTSKETPTTVSRRKLEIDLTPGNDPKDRVGFDISLHYDILISQVINGIVQGFIDNEAQVRIDGEITIYMAGGTASPVGFTKRVAARFDEHDLPFVIKEIKTASKPLYSVVDGCLKACELF